MQQIDNTKLVLSSASVTDRPELYCKLAVAAKPAENNFIKLDPFDPEFDPWP